jgi:hypothetical protein
MYKILGADGRQYGPVNADQLRRWIVEGRANAHTQVLAEGAPEWKPLGALPEFAAFFPMAAPPAFTRAMGHRRTSGSAVWGLILGILSLFCCLCCCLNIPLGALGLIFSLTGLSQISDFPDTYEGRSIAIAGIVVSALGLLLGITIMIANAANGNFQYNHSWHQFHRF